MSLNMCAFKSPEVLITVVRHNQKAYNRVISTALTVWVLFSELGMSPLSFSGAVLIG